METRMRMSNICLIVVKGRQNKETREKTIFQEIVIEKLPELEMLIFIRIPGRIDKTTHQETAVKFQSTKSKEDLWNE